MSNLTEMVILRASPDFVQHLKCLADTEGLSKSEVIRRAVTRERMDFQ